MVTLKNKKELKVFEEKIPEYINLFVRVLNNNGVLGSSEDLANKIDDIQLFIGNKFNNFSEKEQDNIRLGFWAFFSSLLIKRLGGELIIAPKDDFTPYTPLLIDYGNLYDKKGRKSWVSISFDSWLNTILLGKFIGTLNSTMSYIINKYSNGDIKE